AHMSRICGRKLRMMSTALTTSYGLHVVALSDAWQKGAQQLSPEERRNLANDPRNLIPVDGPTNGQKSDSDAASWLPPNKAYRCTYVSQQITVKSIYHLWVTQAEKDAMQKILATC
ncbi:HNH endonuclease family protein, partial [Rhodococcus qingshengii]|uniref:HNH endonuclease family protein n=1 Tax=Rhodococcus qingshengii TaxID=334542 RepID=UPI00287F8CC5